MPEPLEYRIPTKSRRCSVPAVIGFALSIVSTPVGLELYMMAERAVGPRPFLSSVIALPYVAGIVLCVVGLIQTRSSKGSIRGRRAAIAGLFVALIWAVSLVLLFYISAAAHDP